MWPPDFITQIKKQMQENPHTLIADDEWRQSYDEAMQTCVKMMDEAKNKYNLRVTLTEGRVWPKRALELEFFARSIAEHNQAILSGQNSPNPPDTSETILARPK